MPSSSRVLAELGITRKDSRDSVCVCRCHEADWCENWTARALAQLSRDMRPCFAIETGGKKLTFNATSLIVEKLLRLGFVERIPMRSRGQHVRRILVTPEINAVLNSKEPYFPRASVEALVEICCSGLLVSVSRKMEVPADLKKMVGPEEVWAMCFRRPKPGGRLLGRFVERDVYVGLGLYLREDLAGPIYAEKAQKLVDAWAESTGGLPFVKSPDIKSYLGHVFIDYDEEH